MLQKCRQLAGGYDSIRKRKVIKVSRDSERQEVGMLVLSRKLSQQIVIGQDIRITVLKIDRNQVRIGIEAPRDICILREELGERDARRSRAENSAERTEPHFQAV
jgi:carbon storage regulator CsrA